MVARYPEPDIPIRPILSFASFTGGRCADVPSVEDVGQCVWVTSGRIAISLGLQREGIGSGDEVLLPAYNCSTTVDAIESVGAIPVFYKSLPDLSVDLDDVAEKISERTKAFLVVHYFGFPQEMERIREFSDKKGLILIEDCAHAYFGRYRGKPLGSFSDFAITSAMKFFPICDGGVLILPPGKDCSISLHSGGRGFEVKTVINSIERSVRYGRFQPLTLVLKLPLIIKDWLWSALKYLGPYSSRKSLNPGGNGDESLGPGSSYGGYGFDAEWMHVAISRFSRYLIHRLPRARIIEIRRHNYKRLLDALSNYQNAQPVFIDIPDGVVPYAFPLLVSNVDKVFPILKREGVPIYRWEEVSRTVCDVSYRYSCELLQFPCHQEITDKELNWMISRIQSALTSAS